MSEASAYAKLNLCLAVAPPEPARLPDSSPNRRAGWHRIASWFVGVDLADTVRVALSDTPRVSIRFEDPAVGVVDWPAEKDLAARGLQTLSKAVAGSIGRVASFDLEIIKRIPTGGGLGGGSSDAATALMLGNQLLGAPLTPPQLRELASTIGSDVSFFIDEAAGMPRPALVEGFGDRITRAAAPALDAVLILPPIACPTPAVYKAFDAWLAEQSAFIFRDDDARALATGAAGDDATALSSRLFNDLAEPAFRVAPSLRSLRDRCERAARPVHVTGSGSTLFTLAPAGSGDTLAAAIRQAIDPDAPGVRVLATRLATP